MILHHQLFDGVYILLPWGESQNNICQIHDPLFWAAVSNQGLYQLIYST